MYRRNFRASATFFAAALALCLLGSLAWACTVQPRILNLMPLSARPGDSVVVQGEGMFLPSEGGQASPGGVEIRWNDLNGPLLATAIPGTRGEFSSTVVVPNVAPGIYTVVVAQGPQGIGRAVLEVMAATPSSASPRIAAHGLSGLWRGFAPANSAAAEPALSASPVRSQSGLGAALWLTALGAIGLAAAVAGLAGGRARRRTSQLRRG